MSLVTELAEIKALQLFPAVRRNLRRLWLALVSFASLAVLGFTPALADQQRSDAIVRFESTVNINSYNSTLDVVERITVDCTKNDLHNFTRTIPLIVPCPGGGRSVCRFKLKEVKDEQELNVPVEQRQDFDRVELTFDEPDSSSDRHTYTLRYQLAHAINFEQDEPRLGLYVAGENSPYPVAFCQAAIHFPPSVKPDLVKAHASRGDYTLAATAETSQSSNQMGAMVVTDGIVYRAVMLRPGETFWIGASFPPDSINRPALLSDFIWLASDWWLAVAIPAFFLALMSLLWWSQGRDEPAQAQARDWKQPWALDPAEVGTLIDEKCDVRDIVAIIINLATRGYLAIDRLDDSVADYQFIKCIPLEADKPFSDYEKEFMSALFAQGGAGAVMPFRNLRERFFIYLPRIRSSVYGSLTQKGLFRNNPDNVRTSYYSFALVLGVIGIVLLLLQHPVSGIGFLIAAAIVSAFAPAMPACTPEGTAMKQDINKFQKFLNSCDKEEIRRQVEADPSLFWRLLPNALTLGVADKWGAAFDGLVSAPTWFHSVKAANDGDTNFSLESFLSDFQRCIVALERVLTAAPSGSRFTSRHG